MDTRTGQIYDSRELAKAAGVPDDSLVTGTREALEKLRKRIIFSKGSFKTPFRDAKLRDKHGRVMEKL